MIELIVPLCELKGAETVYKLKGTTPYRIKKELKIYYTDNKERKDIRTEGVIFLISESGDITGYPHNYKVKIMFLDQDELLQWLWPEGASITYEEVLETAF